MVAGSKIGGIYGLLISMIVYALIAFLVFAALSNHYLKSSIWGQLWGICQCLLLAFVPMAVTYLLSQKFFLLDLPNIVQIVLGVVVFGVIYITIALVTKNKALKYLLGMLKVKKNG